MKFKTLFSRRPASSLAESAESGTTKRKKKEAKSLTTTMKSGALNGKSTFFASLGPTSRQEKCDPCNNETSSAATAAEVQANGGVGAVTGVDENSCEKPQEPDAQSGNCIRFSCGNCGGRDLHRATPLGAGQAISMKLPDESPRCGENMELEKTKAELNECKNLLVKTQAKIKELTDEVEQVKSASAAKEKEFVQMHDDFLLCIRSAERFRIEAEFRAKVLECEVAELRKQLQGPKNDNHGETSLPMIPVPVEQISAEAAAAAPASEPVTPTGSDTSGGEAMASKKLIRAEWLLSEDTSYTDKVHGPNTQREEKLGMLRKSFRGSLRNGLLQWCKDRTRNYKNVEITNFSTSWSNGLALAALIHSMNPQAFNYDALKPSCPVDNFDTALKAAERLEVKGHLNAIKLITESDNPPWEPIVAYVTEVYLAAPATPMA